jgi:hypothetical protein
MYCVVVRVFVLYILVLIEGTVPLARGSEIPHFWWMCQTMEANAIAFTPPKIWVKHGVLRCVYWWLEGSHDAWLCYICGVFAIDGNPTHHTQENQQTPTSRPRGKPLAWESHVKFHWCSTLWSFLGMCWKQINMTKPIDKGIMQVVSSTKPHSLVNNMFSSYIPRWLPCIFENGHNLKKNNLMSLNQTWKLSCNFLMSFEGKCVNNTQKLLCNA